MMGPLSRMSSALPCGRPSTMSTSTTSARLRIARCRATVPPMLPAPTTVTLNFPGIDRSSSFSRRLAMIGESAYLCRAVPALKYPRTRGDKQGASLEVNHAIETRQSIGRVKQDPGPKVLVEKVLESAVHAPNHKITEPWRFHVFAGKGRGEFARARAELARIQAEAEGEEEEYVAGRISRERKKAFRAPVVIAVISKGGRDEVETLENYAACAAAVQNMQLTAHALDLATIWRTGLVAYHPYMREFFALEAGDKIVAYLYLGYPDVEERPRRREPASTRTVWHEG